MKVLVSGATGFIGSRLVICLRKKKYDLKFLSRSLQSNETIHCDIEKDSIPHIALSNVDTVFHLAGLVHDSRETSETKGRYYKINVNATVDLAKLAVKAGVKKFVFVSSVKAGGSSESKEYLDENNSSNPDDVYGKTKREAELKLLKIAHESNMHVSIIRPSLVYGPNVGGNLQLMIGAIKKGWFPPLPETGNRRSMIHVDDLVCAILLVAEKDHANGEIFIATDGKMYSSREIYNTMCEILGKSIPKWSIPEILLDLASSINPNIKYKINKLLGDEYYSSKKLEKFGFKAQKTLIDMNKTDF